MRLHKAFKRSKEDWELWQELQRAIDESPEIPPCTNFPDLFYGDRGESGFNDIRAAKKLCGTCPIQLQCAQYAIEANEEFGVWGGLSTLDRKNLRKRYGSFSEAAQALELRYKKPRRDGLQANSR